MKTLLDAMMTALRRPFLMTLFFAGNIGLLILFYVWLTIPEGTPGVLAASVIVLLAVIVGAMWLYAMSLAAFHEPSGQPYFFIALRRLPKFAPWAILISGAIFGAGWLASKSRIPFWLAAPLAVLVLLPMTSQAAGGGFSVPAAIRVLARGGYWIAGILAVLLGVLAPKMLVAWIPSVSGLSAQSASLAARFGLALLLGVLSWLMLAAVIGNIGGNIRRKSGN